MVHLSVEQLSALLDGELDLTEAGSARAHLESCAACALELSALSGVDAQLAGPAPVTCAGSLAMRSALLDGELSAAETLVVQAHLARCASCRTEGFAWVSAYGALSALPTAYPSPRVDAAMAVLAGRSPRRARFGTVRAGLVLRTGLAAAVAVALVLGLVRPVGSDPLEPEVALGDGAVLVASAQQVVLNPRNNTLYVLKPDAGAIDALDPATLALYTRINVGGRPTALALNEAANRLIVLDAGARTLTEIDASRNAVVGAQALDVRGTPTGVQVDRANGKILVTSAETIAPAGQVAVLDVNTKVLETTREVAVAPRLVVADPAGRQTLLVSADATTIVDASFRTIQTLPGGVSAAFANRGDRFAVLSNANGAARLSYYGEGAPAAVGIDGTPSAIAALPDGGFAVLVDVGGRGRIVVLDADGRTTGATDLAASGTDLAYDPLSRRFSVASAGRVASALLPTTVAVVAPGASTPAATVSPIASAAPSPSASPAPSSGPVAGSPGPSAAPSAPVESVVAAVPSGATLVAPDLYRISLTGDRMPVLSASGKNRIWFLDQRNALNVLNVDTGAVLAPAQLPADARLRGLAVGDEFVYAVDIAKMRLFALRIADERLFTFTFPVFDVSAITVAPDGAVWIAAPASSHVLRFHPQNARFEAIDIGASAVTLAADRSGRLWFADGQGVLGWYDASGTLKHIGAPGNGLVRALLIDPFDGVWVGTTAGEIFEVQQGRSTFVTRVARPVSSFALDPAGRPWVLAPAENSVGFEYRPVHGSHVARVIPGPVADLTFSSVGRAWFVDRSGGLFLALERAD